MKKLFFLCLVSFSLLFSTPLVIGTAASDGVYFPVGKGICYILNNQNIECLTKETPGSIYNMINTIQTKRLNLSIIQSDIVYNAFNGKDSYEKNPLKKVRTIISLYPELLTLMVKKNATIKNLNDLLTHKISSDKVGSGTKSTVDILAKELLNIYRIQSNVAMPINLIENALNKNIISAFFYVAGHPNKYISDIYKNCNVEFFDFNNDKIPKIKNLLLKHPYYTMGIIPKNTYTNQNKEIKTLALFANLVVSEDMDEELVAKITAILLDNLEELKQHHPALNKLSKENITRGLGAPLHNGAKKIYKERGFDIK